MTITITESAAEKIKSIIAEDPEPNIKLRMFVQGGGCSGFSYGFAIDTEQNEDDFEVESNSVSILVDAMSMQYLNDAVVDFTDDLSGSRFSISNPQAQSTCGCGSSFSM
jgi:iron-sulfur cluster insertion protein